jgi:FlaA1/EpsC-like NDP-sugar epimerase
MFGHGRHGVRPGQAGDAALATILVGAGQAGRTLARALRQASDYGLRPIGFLDDDTAKRSVDGLPVWGPLTALTEVVLRTHAQVVLLAIPDLPVLQVRRLTNAAHEAGASVRYLPSFLAAVERDARASDLRSVSMEALLGRSERDIGEHEGRSIVSGKRVLVTGAGGSIGSELCRQVRRFSPAALYVLDHDESNLHRLQLELSEAALLDSEEIVLADVRDEQRIFRAFQELRPEVVFHAAAHKHLPLLERHPCEGVKTNVRGTQVLIEAAQNAETERFINVSTDKAADPVSILGATKRAAEILIQANALGSTSMGSVRFGNVLGSRGSFLPTLADQLRRGLPVTVTHPDATRYFMTIEEAVGLVLVAGSMAEYGETFVLDMGRPVRIVDLVSSYAAQLGVAEYEVEFTGLRPGEKLHEALVSLDEECVATAHPRVQAARPREIPADLGENIARLYAAAGRDDSEATRRILGRILPEYPCQPARVPVQAYGAAEVVAGQPSVVDVR